MADDKSKRDFRDRDRVSAADAYEVEHRHYSSTSSQSTATAARHWKGKHRLCEADPEEGVRCGWRSKPLPLEASRLLGTPP